LVPRERCSAAEHAVGRLEQLAARVEPFGRGVRFRQSSRRTDRGAARLCVPGWCNGSAGGVLWLAAHAATGVARYAELAELCAWTAWDHPDQHGDLCCGGAGRSYSLLAQFRSTGEQAWLERARALARTAIQSIRQRTLRRDSLFKGEPGVAVLAADFADPQRAAMPFFETEWR
jgi:hypothetical protein